MGQEVYKLAFRSFKTVHESHLANPLSSALALKRKLLKDKAIENNDKPVKIIQDIVTSCNGEIGLRLAGEKAALKAVVKRMRKNTSHSRDPRGLDEFAGWECPDKFKLSLDGSDWLQADLTLSDGNKILIFFTHSDMVSIAASRVMLMDGTFGSLPAGFKQLYSMMVEVANDYSELFQAKAFF